MNTDTHSDSSSASVADNTREQSNETREVCNTCVRPASNPFRVYDEHGKVTEGCVDRFHDAHLIAISESNRWHNRREAKQIRIANKQWLRNLRLNKANTNTAQH